MNRAYWDDLAENYEEEIFSVLKNDANKKISESIKRYSGGKKIAIDLGCGIGHIIPLLVNSYAKVHAVDISSQCLKRAEQSNKEFDNVQYWHLDMSKASRKIPKEDLLLSVNSVISPSISIRTGLFRSIKNKISRGGHLLLVVPSLESSLFVDNRTIEMNLRNKSRPSVLIWKGFKRNELQEIHAGTKYIEGVATKHYLYEELIALINKLELTVISIEKNEYSWKTEFTNPPKWLDSPYPWDWFVIAKN